MIRYAKMEFFFSKLLLNVEKLGYHSTLSINPLTYRKNQLSHRGIRGRGTEGRETGRKGGGRCTGGGRRGGGKRDSQGGGKREKKGRITQHCAIFRNRKNAKGREPKNTGREPGLKGTGSGRFKPACPPPPYKGEFMELPYGYLLENIYL